MSAKQSQSKSELWVNMAASGSCIGAAVALFNPLDCLRIRWQVHLHTENAAKDTIYGFGRQIVRSEGMWAGLWGSGLLANIGASAGSRGIGIGAYPVVRDTLTMVAGKDEKSAPVMFLAGLLSGGTGYGLLTPLWVSCHLHDL